MFGSAFQRKVLYTQVWSLWLLSKCTFFCYEAGESYRKWDFKKLTTISLFMSIIYELNLSGNIAGKLFTWVLFHWERLEKMRNWNGAAVKQGWSFVTAVGQGQQREWHWDWNTGERPQSEISSNMFDGNKFSFFIQCFCVRNWKVQWPNYFFIVLAWLQVTAISYWLKIIVANYVAVETAHALSLPLESVPFNENSLC